MHKTLFCDGLANCTCKAHRVLLAPEYTFYKKATLVIGNTHEVRLYVGKKAKYSGTKMTTQNPAWCTAAASHRERPRNKQE